MGGLFAAVGIVALLLLAGGGGGAKKPIKPCNTPDDLDEPLKTTVKTALASEKDPAVLDAMAKSLQASCPAVAKMVQDRADAIRKAGVGGTAPATKIDCAKSSTWPADVQSMWTEYQAHKGDPSSSAYATSGKAQKLRDRFTAIGCFSNAATVNKTISSWGFGAGTTPKPGIDCEDPSTWPASIAGPYNDYLASPCDWVAAGLASGAADRLQTDLSSIGCASKAAAVQITISSVKAGLCGPGTGDTGG